MTEEQIDEFHRELRANGRADLEEVDLTEVYSAAEFEAYRNGRGSAFELRIMGPIATLNPAIGAVPRRTMVELRRVTAALRRSGRYPRCIGKTSTSQPWNEVALFRTRKPTTATRPRPRYAQGMSRTPEASRVKFVARGRSQGAVCGHATAIGLPLHA